MTVGEEVTTSRKLRDYDSIVRCRGVILDSGFRTYRNVAAQLRKGAGVALAIMNNHPLGVRWGIEKGVRSLYLHPESSLTRLPGSPMALAKPVARCSLPSVDSWTVSASSLTWNGQGDRVP